MSRGSDEDDLVYSTGSGRMCPRCARPVTACTCPKGKRAMQQAAGPRPAGRGVRVSRETKGRKGKGVTVITGLPLDAAALEDLAKTLKARCGAGGTVRDGVIEIQGEHRERLLAELRALGHDAR